MLKTTSRTHGNLLPVASISFVDSLLLNCCLEKLLVLTGLYVCPAECFAGYCACGPRVLHNCVPDVFTVGVVYRG